MMSELEAKFNSATDFLGVASLGSVLLSGILLFTPVKTIGYIGLGSGLGAFSASVVARKKHLGIAEKQVSTLANQHRSELLRKDDEIAVLNGTVDGLAIKVKGFEKATKSQVDELTRLQQQVDSLTVQNQSKSQTIEQVIGELDRLITLARTAVEESLDEWETKLSSLVATKKCLPYSPARDVFMRERCAAAYGRSLIL